MSKILYKNNCNRFDSIIFKYNNSKWDVIRLEKLIHIILFKNNVELHYISEIVIMIYSHTKLIFS